MGGETRRKFDEDFPEGAVLLVRETGKPTAQVARDRGINEGTLGNWAATGPVIPVNWKRIRQSMASPASG